MSPRRSIFHIQTCYWCVVILNVYINSELSTYIMGESADLIGYSSCRKGVKNCSPEPDVGSRSRGPSGEGSGTHRLGSPKFLDPFFIPYLVPVFCPFPVPKSG